MRNLDESKAVALRRIFPEFDSLSEFEKGVAVGKVELLAALYPAVQPPKSAQ